MLAGIVAEGRAPGLDAIASELGTGPADVAAALRDLEAGHGIVLHPESTDVWAAHPFSLVPTGTWVATDRRGWWAPCIWCALGIATLTGRDARIHTHLAAEHTPVVIRVRGDEVSPASLCAHFPVPVARAWDNVHRFCGSTLVFESERQVDAWCARHGQDRGDVLSLVTVDALASRWYGAYLDPDWRKWTVAEARRIFRDVGLTGPTWELPETDGTF